MVSWGGGVSGKKRERGPFFLVAASHLVLSWFGGGCGGLGFNPPTFSLLAGDLRTAQFFLFFLEMVGNA